MPILDFYLSHSDLKSLFVDEQLHLTSSTDVSVVVLTPGNQHQGLEPLPLVYTPLSNSKAAAQSTPRL